MLGTANRATSATTGIPIPNSRTILSDTSSRSPNHGSPGTSRLIQAITSIATAPKNTTAAAASIHHQSSMMLCACGLRVERIDCLPQPASAGALATQAIRCARAATDGGGAYRGNRESRAGATRCVDRLDVPEDAGQQRPRPAR